MNVNQNKINVPNPSKKPEFLIPLPPKSNTNKTRGYIENILKFGPATAINRDALGGFRLADNSEKSRQKITTPSTRKFNNSDLTKSTSFNKSVTSVVSRRTDTVIDDGSFDKSDESTNVVLALTEGRGYARGEVGIASIDTKRPKLILSQFSDNIWYTGILTKLNMQSPVQIIFPETFTSVDKNSKLISFIKNMYPKVKIESIPRRHFSDAIAKEYIDKLCSPKTENVKFMFQQKFYALAAAGALFKYLEFRNINFARKTLKIEYETLYGNMCLDVETSHRLELLYPLCENREKRSCLYGVLNNCVTAIGKRNLRAKILQPTCDIPTIEAINQCITELMLKDVVLADIHVALKHFYNVDRLLRLSYIVSQDDNIRAAEIMINLALLLKTCLENINSLQFALENIESPVLIEMRETLKDPRYSFLLEQINTILSSEAEHCTGNALYFQRLFTVKSNVNELLDLTRKFYQNWIDKMNDTVKEMSKNIDMPMKLIYAKTRGFHIQMSIPKDKEAPKLAEDYELLYTKGYNVFLTTSELTKMNFELNEVIQKIQTMSNTIICNLFMKFQTEIDVIYVLTGVISELDIIHSLAIISKQENYCCPTFGDEMRIIDAIHPFLEHNQSKSSCVSNNVIATPEFNFFVITGPNMGGKTIYIKMIGILQIMAQLGCFIPAKEASFRICDKLFTRLGFGDKMEQSASSFTIEMRDMEYILKNITPNSLVLADEMCRSTNPKEGKIIAWKICEQLIKMYGVSDDGHYFNNILLNGKKDDTNINIANIASPFVFVVTHFIELTRLSEKYKNVFNLHLKADEEVINDKTHLKFIHKVGEGINPITGYGMALARTIDFPYKIIPRAEELLKSIPQIPEEDISIFSSSINGIQHSNFNNTTINMSLINDIERKLYDFFSNLMTIYRNQNDSNVGNNLNILLKDFLEVQDDSFVDVFNSREMNDTIAGYSFVERSPNANNFNMNDLSFHSIQRRLNEKNLTHNIGVESKKTQSSHLEMNINEHTSNNRILSETICSSNQTSTHDTRNRTYVILKENAQTCSIRKLPNSTLGNNRVTLSQYMPAEANNENLERSKSVPPIFINSNDSSFRDEYSNHHQIPQNVQPVTQDFVNNNNLKFNERRFTPYRQRDIPINQPIQQFDENSFYSHSQFNDTYFTPDQPIDIPTVFLKPRPRNLGLPSIQKLSKPIQPDHTVRLQHDEINTTNFSKGVSGSNRLNTEISNINDCTQKASSVQVHKQLNNKNLHDDSSFLGLITNKNNHSFFNDDIVDNEKNADLLLLSNISEKSKEKFIEDQNQIRMPASIDNLSFLEHNDLNNIFSMASPNLFANRRLNQQIERESNFVNNQIMQHRDNFPFSGDNHNDNFSLNNSTFFDRTANSASSFKFDNNQQLNNQILLSRNRSEFNLQSPINDIHPLNSSTSESNIQIPPFSILPKPDFSMFDKVQYKTPTKKFRAMDASFPEPPFEMVPLEIPSNMMHINHPQPSTSCGISNTKRGERDTRLNSQAFNNYDSSFSGFSSNNDNTNSNSNFSFNSEILQEKQMEVKKRNNQTSSELFPVETFSFENPSTSFLFDQQKHQPCTSVRNRANHQNEILNSQLRYQNSKSSFNCESVIEESQLSSSFRFMSNHENLPLPVKQEKDPFDFDNMNESSFKFMNSNDTITNKNNSFNLDLNYTQNREDTFFNQSLDINNRIENNGDLFNTTRLPTHFRSQNINHNQSETRGNSLLHQFENRYFNSENILESDIKNPDQSSFIKFKPNVVSSPFDLSKFQNFKNNQRFAPSSTIQEFLASDDELDRSLRMSNSNSESNDSQKSINHSIGETNLSLDRNIKNKKSSATHYKNTTQTLTNSTAALNVAPLNTLIELKASTTNLLIPQYTVAEDDINMKREQVRQQTAQFLDKIIKPKILQQTAFRQSKVKDNRIWHTDETKSKKNKKDSKTKK